nr:hypothetical protein [uncultured Agathobacter sp.]
MSRILKHKKKAIIILTIIIIEIIIAFICNDCMPYIGIIDIVIIAIYIVNRKVVKIMLKQTECFSPYSDIRNVKFLIIGEKCRISDIIKKNDAYVQIIIPNATSRVCFEILKHTSSILADENSCVIFVTKCLDRNKRKCDVLETFFYHDVTLKKYNIKHAGIKRKLPFLFSPINCLKLLAFNVEREVKGCDAQSGLGEIYREVNKFCECRNYDLKIYKI